MKQSKNFLIKRKKNRQQNPKETLDALQYHSLVFSVIYSSDFSSPPGVHFYAFNVFHHRISISFFFSFSGLRLYIVSGSLFSITAIASADASHPRDFLDVCLSLLSSSPASFSASSYYCCEGRWTQEVT